MSPEQKLAVHAGPIPGTKLLESQVFADNRGSFFKLYHKSTWRNFGLDLDFVESFVSVSTAGVLRGMHFQLPPAEHDKVVWVIDGRVFDVVLDLRRHEDTFGIARGTVLESGRINGIYIPIGFAHGFYVERGPATLLYMTTSMHDPEYDSGIHWDSFGFAWPANDPVMSERDVQLQLLGEFESPW